MDILCRVCGEPFDNDEFHAIAEEAADPTVTYSSLVSDFGKRGCKALEPFTGPQSCQPTGDDREVLIGAVFDGSEDMDFAAGSFDDLEL